ncbi:solute carrier family 26 protein [Pontibacter sp. G13]|uniref:SulP family inorganic anion transporter n=1 Tax=Pontibacter sp. G13 TaxID=3074898 RepID=UPI002889AD86|nr:solute carrier family 26 protein [Pontibacter sp. G13]WNJ20162.1 solute carrier family 26 protein [Pontibacter sp. G13]
MQIRKFLPITDWIKTYDRSMLSGDLSAGLTVGVMLIPQGMAYSMLAGLPPIYGLYASIVPLILYALFGTSRQLAVGPVAMVALLIATGVGAIVPADSVEFIAYAILLALMVGIIQLLMGMLRLGFLVDFLSHPVISGFTSAAALIIGLSQLKHLLGLDIPRSSHIHEIIGHVAANISDIHLPTILLGLGAIAVLLAIKKFKIRIPGALVVVILGTLAVYLGKLDGMGMKIVGDVPSGLPSFGIPLMEWSAIQALFPMALTISLVGFMESFAVAKSIQAKHKNYEVDANQELIALGVANIGGSFFQAFPTTGGFSRTAVNDQAGAQSGMASLISAALIMVTLLFLTPLFYYLPKAVLAAIIMVAVFGLIDIKEVKHLWHADRQDLMMLLATFAATLTLGIEEGIAVGVGLSLLMVIIRTAYPHMARMGKMPEADIFRNVGRFEEAEEHPEYLVVRLDAPLYFANANRVRSFIEKQQKDKHGTLKGILFNMEAVNGLDSSGAHMLAELAEDLQRDGIALYLTDIKGPIRDIMHRHHLPEALGSGRIYTTLEEAWHCLNGRDPKLATSYWKQIG